MQFQKGFSSSVFPGPACQPPAPKNLLSEVPVTFLALLRFFCLGSPLHSPNFQNPQMPPGKKISCSFQLALDCVPIPWNSNSPSHCPFCRLQHLSYILQLKQQATTTKYLPALEHNSSHYLPYCIFNDWPLKNEQVDEKLLMIHW